MTDCHNQSYAKRKSKVFKHRVIPAQIDLVCNCTPQIWTKISKPVELSYLFYIGRKKKWSHENFGIYSHIYIWPEPNLTKIQKIISRSKITVEKTKKRFGIKKVCIFRKKNEKKL